MGLNISKKSEKPGINQDDYSEAKIIHLCDVKPTRVKYEKEISVTSTISNFIKESEKNFPANRQHITTMKQFDGSKDVGYKGAGDYGFFTAIYECYNNHWALKTIPDDWWYTIIRTIAISIDNAANPDFTSYKAIGKLNNSEEIRKFFVDHDGKKRLTVDVGPTLQHVNYDDFFRQMSDLIQSNVKVNNYVDTIRSNFSTSTPTHQIVSEITVMSSMQEFFEYCMRTKCGIPYVVVLGSEEDWVLLKTKFLKLKEILNPIDHLIELNQWWDRVEIICDKLIDTVKGNVDKKWWSRIFTETYHKGEGFGSGSIPAHTTYDGWFLRDLLNISEAKSFKSLPSGLVSVPLVFAHMDGAETNGGIVSGIAGIKISQSNNIPAVESIHGWAVFHELKDFTKRTGKT